MANNNSHNIYNTLRLDADDEEMESLLNSSNTLQKIVGNNQPTTINIENDITASTSQHHLQSQQQFQQRCEDVDSTRINMETNVINVHSANGAENTNIYDRPRMLSLFSMLREARHQLNRSQSLRDTLPSSNGDNSSDNTHSRTWRENLYEVLSSPVSPRTHRHVLRAIFTPSSSANVRSNVLIPHDNFHVISQAEEEFQPSLRIPNSNGLETTSSSALRLSRQNSRSMDDSSLNENSISEQQTPAIDLSANINGRVTSSVNRQSNTAGLFTNGGRLLQRQASVGSSTAGPTEDMIDDIDTNAVGEILVEIVTQFIRYLPFIFLIFVKFIHDHLLGILDILVLQSLMYEINNTVKEQVAKHNQKSFAILVRNLILVVCAVIYRFTLSTSIPDLFGLIINPPRESFDLSSIRKLTSKEVYLDMKINSVADSENYVYEVPSSAPTNSLNSTISVSKAISLGTLLYYVAVNDLILKLMTQLIKLIVTMLPNKVILHKSRGRLYALIENISQFYRALVPIKQWLKFLFISNTGLEVISGILFSSFYVGAKLYDLFERGKPLKNAFIIFMRNMEYDRKPTKDELETAGSVCPICHDSYSSPALLECGHIFCDECVNTWFKREQTCPMCRAKVSEDPTWQDGATTYFYQLC